MKSQEIGILKEVPVAFRGLFVSVYFLVVEGSYFDVIICDPTMEDLERIIDLGRWKVSLIKGNKYVGLPFIPNDMREKTVTEDTYIDDFTSAISTVLSSSKKSEVEDG